MRKLILEEGFKKGKLTYIKEVEPHLQKGKKIRTSLFLCDCGNYKEVNFYHFINGRVTGCGKCNADANRYNGKKYGSITVISFVRYNVLKNGRKVPILLGECECGSIKEYGYNNLPLTKSCGCKTLSIIKEKNVTHGMTDTLIYRIYRNVKNRCYNKKTDSYKHYGGRGIKMCDRWLNSFEAFYEDMGEKPSPTHSIERDDVNGDYCKENCRWASPKEQANNKTNSVFISYNGVRLTQSQWADKFGLKQNRIHFMLKTKSIEQLYEKYITSLQGMK